MDQQNTASSPTNGASTGHELFVLTDEQILEIEPEALDRSLDGHPANREKKGASSPSVILSEPQVSEGSQPQRRRGLSNDEILRDAKNASLRMTPQSFPTEHGSRTTDHNAQAGVPVPPEPPGWLAAQMKDPWSGEEARELWNGVLQARQEAAAYRAAFATPEDARALKELYPGGVNEARTTARRAQILDDIDRAYFGAPDTSPEQLSTTRAQLAATMLREDPAAFREMVFVGLRALEQAEQGSSALANVSNVSRLAQVFSSSGAGLNVAPPFRATSATTETQPQQEHARLKPGATQNSDESPVTSHQSLASTYAAFEKAANEDLERSVGAAISRTIEQALPNLQRSGGETDAGARHGVPLRERLGLAVRQDVEAVLKGDRQLGEQIAQVLSGRRFDNETRAQVVRLIDDRARQLVPSAAKRVINDWTHATLGAHRGNAARADAASARREVEPASSPSGMAAVSINSPRAAQTRPGADPNRSASRSDSRRINYRKLSDEQILEL